MKAPEWCSPLHRWFVCERVFAFIGLRRYMNRMELRFTGLVDEFADDPSYRNDGWASADAWLVGNTKAARGEATRAVQACSAVAGVADVCRCIVGRSRGTEPFALDGQVSDFTAVGSSWSTRRAEWCEDHHATHSDVFSWTTPSSCSPHRTTRCGRRAHSRQVAHR